MPDNVTLRFGMRIDRDYLFDFFETMQMLLPLFDTLTLHPYMLFMLLESKTMSSDIRHAFVLIEIPLIFYDWIFNFCLRMYPITPYIGFYCGGPICRILDSRSILMTTFVILTMSSNVTFRFGLGIDREYLFDFFESFQITLPIFNTFTVHSLMLYMLSQTRTMRYDVRLGYFLTEISLIAFDWILNFGFRLHPITPYSGFYCGGPACRLIESRSAIMFLLSSALSANIPCFLFLVIRMHNKTCGRLKSIIKLTHKRQALLMITYVAILATNIWGFTIFGVDCDNSASIRNVPELRWLTDRGVKIFLFGTFGDAQYFRYELYILGISLLLCAPIPVLVTLDAMRNLHAIKTSTVSYKTHKMTHQLLKMFIAQLNGAMIFMVLPLSLLLSSMIFDLHASLSSNGLLALRVMITILLALDPFQFKLSFILMSTGSRANSNSRRVDHFFHRIGRKDTEITTSTITNRLG